MTTVVRSSFLCLACDEDSSDDADELENRRAFRCVENCRSRSPPSWSVESTDRERCCWGVGRGTVVVGGGGGGDHVGRGVSSCCCPGRREAEPRRGAIVGSGLFRSAQRLPEVVRDHGRDGRNQEGVHREDDDGLVGAQGLFVLQNGREEVGVDRWDVVAAAGAAAERLSVLVLRRQRWLWYGQQRLAGRGGLVPGYPRLYRGLFDGGRALHLGAPA